MSTLYRKKRYQEGKNKLNAQGENLTPKDTREHSPNTREEETVDEILEGQLKIIQKAKGYRFSIDSLLLAYFVCLKKDDLVLDMGTGSAVISLILANCRPCRKVIGIEIQEELVDMAQRNVTLNGLDSKVEICQGDIVAIDNIFTPHSFDVVLFNPPYRKLRSGRINPDYQKSVARHEIKGSLNDFIAASEYVLKISGHVYIIYPASRIVDLLDRMRKFSIEPKRIQVVHSTACSRGEFVLVEGIKGGREQVLILPPLFIYGSNGVYTDRITRIFRELSGCRQAVCE